MSERRFPREPGNPTQQTQGSPAPSHLSAIQSAERDLNRRYRRGDAQQQRQTEPDDHL